MMSVFFHFQHTLDRLFNNCIKLYWYKISSSWKMKRGSNWPPPLPSQEKLPSKSPDLLGLRIQWRLSTILKTSKKVYEVMFFWYVKVCIFWKCILYAMHWDKTQVLKKFPSDKINATRNALFFPLFSFANSNFSQFYF